MTWQPKNLTRKQMAERRCRRCPSAPGWRDEPGRDSPRSGCQRSDDQQVEKGLGRKWTNGFASPESSGRPPRLSWAQKEQLVEKLEQGALAAGFPTEQWTQARVKKVIEQEFGVRYHRDYISRLLKGLGWSVQKLDPRAIERDEELIQAWLSQDWPG